MPSKLTAIENTTLQSYSESVEKKEDVGSQGLFVSVVGCLTSIVFGGSDSKPTKIFKPDRHRKNVVILSVVAAFHPSITN